MRPPLRPSLFRPILAAPLRAPRRFLHRPPVLPEFTLEGKVAIVTGGARGLGREFLTALSLSGAKSICADLRLSDSLKSIQAVEAECAATDPDLAVELAPYECDVTDEGSVKNLFDFVERQYGRVDVLITAAGICQNVPAVEYEIAEWKKVMDVNLTGTFICAREAGRRMLAAGNGGSIILVSSMSAHIVNRPQPQCAYNASKAGVSHLARSLAAEWAGAGIRVNSLCPGYQMTELLRGVMAREGEGLKNAWETLTPMRRLGNPKELRSKVVFLASDAGSFMTGQDLVVDGGYEIW